MPFNNDKPVEIRDLRNGDWLWVQKTVLADDRLSAADFRAYSGLASFTNEHKKDQIAYPSVNEIAQRTSLSARQVRISTSRLANLHYIQKLTHQAGNKTIYILLRVSKANSAPLGVGQILPESEAKFSKSEAIATPEVNYTKNTNKNINNNDNTIVLSGDKPLTYGNGDINSLIDYLKEKLGLPALDGSQKQNRRYCWLCLNKFGGPEKIRLLIDATNQSDFWKTKITSFSQLYYKAVRIISETRKGGYAVDATQLR